MGDDERIAHPLYDSVLRRVLWDEKQEEIMRTFEINGVPMAEADLLYHEALAERLAAIRRIFLKRIFIGAFLIAIGCISLWVVYSLTEGFTVWSTQSVLIPAAPIAFGAWKFLNGIVGFLTAGNRRGPVSDIE